ncbi:MAG: hypothetical protein ABEJ72_09500 [Candidatus Aenigmatarchaeota archaeon]
MILTTSGCIGDSNQTSRTKTVKKKCIEACEKALQNGRNLSRGPCLLDPVENSNWVCDVAHDPRKPVDNQRENQCDAWHNGTADRFIEVTPDCDFIRTN